MTRERIVPIAADGFHRVRAERHRRGVRSPDGFRLDSHDYPALIGNALVPEGLFLHRDVVVDNSDVDGPRVVTR